MFACAGTPAPVTGWLSVTSTPATEEATLVTTAPAGIVVGPLTDMPVAIAFVGGKCRTAPEAVAALVAKTNGLDGPPEPTAKSFWTARMKAAMRADVSPGSVKLGSQVGLAWKNCVHCCAVTAANAATVVGEPRIALATIASPSAPVKGAGSIAPCVSAHSTRLRKAAGCAAAAPGQNLASSSPG